MIVDIVGARSSLITVESSDGLGRFGVVVAGDDDELELCGEMSQFPDRGRRSLLWALTYGPGVTRGRKEGPREADEQKVLRHGERPVHAYRTYHGDRRVHIL